QFAVEAAARAVAIDRGQQDLAGAAIGRFAGPFDRFAPIPRRPAAPEDFVAIAFALGIDRDDHGLAAVRARERRNQRGLRERRAFDADLVGARPDDRAHI